MSLRKKVLECWEHERSGFLPTALRGLSVPYALGMRLRNQMFRSGMRKTCSLSVPVVSVGNITVGGVGKTPLVEYVVRFYLEKGLKTAVVSRGYGRKSKVEPLVVSRGDGPCVSAEDGGDEPVMLAGRLPELSVVVGGDRVKAGTAAIDECGAEIIILDDGFQHIRLARDLNICALDGSRPLGNGRVFPAGPLRESPSNLTRADFLFFTRATGVTELDARGKLCEKARAFEEIPCAGGTLKATGITNLRTREKGDKDVLKGESVIAVSGIGSPDSFERTLEHLGAKVSEHFALPDHYFYTEDNIEEIVRTASQRNCKKIVTTMKDAVRLESLLNDKPTRGVDILVLNTEMTILWNEDRLRNALSTVL